MEILFKTTQSQIIAQKIEVDQRVTLNLHGVITSHTFPQRDQNQKEL